MSDLYSVAVDPLFDVLDGGLSTSLDEQGVHVGGALWTAGLLMSDPGAIRTAHSRNLEAGAEVLITSSYQASEDGFRRAGASGAQAESLLRLTTQLARDAVAAGAIDAAGGERSVRVAASCGPFGAVLADGSEYHGRYAARLSEVRAFHRRRLRVLADTGPDLIAIETIPTLSEARLILDEHAALGAAPCWVSFSDADVDPDGVAALVADFPAVGAVGVNCVAFAEVGRALRRLTRVVSVPLIAYPNRGGQWDATTKSWTGERCDFSAHPGGPLREWISLGARLIGGCCGNGVADVAALADAKRSMLA